MGDDSRKSLVYSLKNEWSLLWQSIAGDHEQEVDLRTMSEDQRNLTLDDLRAMSRELSQDRLRLHRRLESLHKEIELNTAKLDSLRLVGADNEETVRRINELSEQGQRTSQELADLDHKIRMARDHEERIREITA